MRHLLVLLLLAAAAPLPPRAPAAPPGDFESPPPSHRTPGSGPFAGVTFETGPPLAAPSLPVIRTTGALSPTHTLDISESGDEFPIPRVVGRFDQTRQTVTVWLRNVTAGSFSTAMRLDLYNAAGTSV